MAKLYPKLPVIGWREYVSLPNLGIRSIKAKVDTGARSSSIHAFDIELFEFEGADWVQFKVHPIQHSALKIVTAKAPVLDLRNIRSSSGETSERIVISTTVSLGGLFWPIEMTLANRDQMGFRMLLGREAIRGRAVVDPGRSYYLPKPPRVN